MTTNQSFRKNVLRLMTAQGVSTQNLAKAIGIAPYTCEIMLKQDVEIDQHLLNKIAKKLHTDPDDLLIEQAVERKTAYDIMTENIRAWRERHGISAAELARKTGMTTQGIYLIEKHQTNPTLSSITKIADAMNVSIAQLFTPAAKVEKRIDQKPQKSVLYDTIYTAVLAALKEAK